MLPQPFDDDSADDTRVTALGRRKSTSPGARTEISLTHQYGVHLPPIVPELHRAHMKSQK
jgi:hypothetical protein